MSSATFFADLRPSPVSLATQPRAPRCDPKNLVGPMTRRLRLALDGHDPAQCYQPLRAATLHPVVFAVDHLQRRLGGRCCKLGLIHRLGRCPKDSGWLVRRPGRQLLVAGIACRRCPFPLVQVAGLLACVWCSQLLAAVGVREAQCAAQFATAVVRVALLRRAAGRRRCRRLGFPGRVLAWCCWRDRPGTCRRPSPRCIASAPLWKFVVGVGSVTA